MTADRTGAGFLARSALALVATTVVTSGLGFVYWALAARSFPARVVGESATAIAAMNLIAPLTTLGLGTLLLAELPAMRGRRTEAVVSAALLSGATAAALALLAALVLPTEVLGLPGLGTATAATALFVAGVSAQGVGLVLDAALLGVEGGGLQLWRNATLSVVKLLLLAVVALALADRGSLSIYASWFVANVVSIVLVALLLVRRRSVPWRRLRPARTALSGLSPAAARHHALNLALTVPYVAMPIVASVVLGSAQAGYLYATWSVAGLVFALPLALATALFASGADDVGGFGARLRLTLRWSLAGWLAATLVAVPLAGPVLRVFGAAYADNGRTALVLLCLGGFGLVLKDHHVAIARVTGRVGREAVLVTGLTVLELAGAAVGAWLDGLTGIAQGWLVAVLVGSVIYAPRVLAVHRRGLPLSAG